MWDLVDWETIDLLDAWEALWEAPGFVLRGFAKELTLRQTDGDVSQALCEFLDFRKSGYWAKLPMVPETKASPREVETTGSHPAFRSRVSMMAIYLTTEHQSHRCHFVGKADWALAGAGTGRSTKLQLRVPDVRIR